MTLHMFRHALWLAALLVNPVIAGAQELHVNLRFQFGGTDTSYPGCNGRMLAFTGGSLEIGTPIFIELLAESMSTGGDDCQPGIATDDPEQPFAGAVLIDPTWRAGIGAGRKFVSQRVLLSLRGGAFVNTREPFVSGNAGFRLFVFTVGLEFGQVRGHWQFENGVEYDEWSKFGGLSLGLRF